MTGWMALLVLAGCGGGGDRGPACDACEKAQQHMIDKGHCRMNMEDEDEYVDFYDFSKTYENHPLLIK